MTKTLYILRHGETDWNKAKRFQGHSNIDLNDLGREQAAALQDILAHVQPEIIVSSDLSRAHNTAKIAAQKLLLDKPNTQIITTPLLREAHLGDVEGLERETISERYGADFIEKWFDPNVQDFSFPRGESKSAHLSRLLRSISDLLDAHSHLSRFAISTHGGSVHRLIHFCENRPQERLFVSNGSLHEIELTFGQSGSTPRWLYKGEWA